MKVSKINNFVLDDALRHLYICLRNSRASIVAIRFIHGGKQWEADTAEEAVRLRQQLENADEVVRNCNLMEEARAIRSESVWTPDMFWSFIQTIGPKQAAFAAELVRNDEGMPLYSDDLVSALEIDEQSLGGVLSGLSKQLKQLGLRPEHVYWVHTDWSNSQRIRVFFVQRAFKLAAEEVGWPKEERSYKCPRHQT